MLVNCEDLSVPPDGIKRRGPVGSGIAKRIRRVLPKPQSAMAQEDLDEMAQTKVEEKGEAFHEAVANNDIDAMWAIWCAVAESNLVERAAVEACEPKVIGDPRYYGRGFASEVRKVRVEKIPDEDLKVVPDEDRRAVHKLLNLLQELPATASKDLLWSKIQRVGMNALTSKKFLKIWELPSAPTEEFVAKLTEDVAFGSEESYLVR